MAGERLFGLNVRPACKYCEHVVQVLREDNLLCDKRGSVTKEHKCRLFIYDPLKRVPRRPKTLEQFDEADFAL